MVPGAPGTVGSVAERCGPLRSAWSGAVGRGNSDATAGLASRRHGGRLTARGAPAARAGTEDLGQWSGSGASVYCLTPLLSSAVTRNLTVPVALDLSVIVTR